MDIADDLQVAHLIDAEFVASGVRRLAVEKPTVAHPADESSVAIAGGTDVAIVDFASGDVVEAGVLTDGVGLYPRLRFAIADGTCVIVIDY